MEGLKGQHQAAATQRCQSHNTHMTHALATRHSLRHLKHESRHHGQAQVGNPSQEQIMNARMTHACISDSWVNSIHATSQHRIQHVTCSVEWPATLIASVNVLQPGPQATEARVLEKNVHAQHSQLAAVTGNNH